MGPPKKYRNRYRIASSRLPAWDYSSAGWYFITMCVKDHACMLGEVTDGINHLSTCGSIVAEEWLKTATLRNHIELDEWVVMPNHVHGILVITRGNGPGFASSGCRIAPNSLGSIVGQFKSTCTRRIRASGLSAFGWQPGYFDHIIRDEKTLADIRAYIRDNPLKWEMDKGTPSNF